MDNYVFISGGMTNVPDFKNKFLNAENELIKMGYINIFNPAKFSESFPKEISHDACMVIDLAVLSVCDKIYMLNGWEQSVGSKQEYEYAMINGISIMYQNGDSNV